MPPKKQSRTEAQCEVCKDNASKYRCSQCPVRYCSVACYKKHKEVDCIPANRTAASESSIPKLDVPEQDADIAEDRVEETEAQDDKPLKPLTDISWPPEPDSSIFTDPLKKDDPKPLRREEFMRIATSPQLRQVLANPKLPRILRILDSLATPNARSSCLARLLGVDEISLSKPGQESIVNRRDSPPPLGELLMALSGKMEDERARQEDDGWLLRSETDRIWIGEEEKKLMRVWAGMVVESIDGDGRDEWGQGDLAWEV